MKDDEHSKRFSDGQIDENSSGANGYKEKEAQKWGYFVIFEAAGKLVANNREKNAVRCSVGKRWKRMLRYKRIEKRSSPKTTTPVSLPAC